MKYHGRKLKISVVFTPSRYRLLESYAKERNISVGKLVEMWSYILLKHKVSQQVYDSSELEDYTSIGQHKAADELLTTIAADLNFPASTTP